MLVYLGLMKKVVYAALAAAKLVVYFVSGRDFGYFRDEMYYLACGRHLAWGYVDQPPLIAFLAWVLEKTLSEAVWAIRILPALAGAGEAVMTAMIAGELGGGIFAQALAGICVVVAGGILSVNNFFSMNAFEPLMWMGCAWIVIRMVKTGNTKLWIWFGVVAGIGLENKHSMLIFGAGIVVGLLLTEQRRLLWSRWVLVGGAIAFLIFLPNLLWNIRHHFPFLEEQANIRRSGRDVPLGPVAFFAQEILAMHPLALPVWLAGLWFYFARKEGKRFRALGWAWVFSAAVIVAMSPRIYYLFPAFPLLFAGGAMVWEAWVRSPVWRTAYAALLVVTGAMLAPIAILMLPPEKYIAYTRALHVEQPRIERMRLGPLPQIFADHYGWPEMAEEVARVYNGLPEDVRAKTAIFGRNYGEAGAIDVFGPKYGLPAAISGHQSYFLWGPRGYTGESMIVMGGNRRELERRFQSVELAAHVDHPYSMPYEHIDIFYCRGLQGTLEEVWPSLKNWD